MMKVRDVLSYIAMSLVFALAFGVGTVLAQEATIDTPPPAEQPLRAKMTGIRYSQGTGIESLVIYAEIIYYSDIAATIPILGPLDPESFPRSIAVTQGSPDTNTDNAASQMAVFMVGPSTEGPGVRAMKFFPRGLKWLVDNARLPGMSMAAP